MWRCRRSKIRGKGELVEGGGEEARTVSFCSGFKSKYLHVKVVMRYNTI
jgi:hypothetical protein